jgi:hypothetical protein
VDTGTSCIALPTMRDYQLAGFYAHQYLQLAFSPLPNELQ